MENLLLNAVRCILTKFTNILSIKYIEKRTPTKFILSSKLVNLKPHVEGHIPKW